MMHRVVGAVFIGAALLSGCAASSSSQSQPDSLSGTSWTLVAFRQAAANASEVRPARPDQYRLSFQADGRLVAQVDCNRGNGTWQATPAGSGGSLHLGPMALTRMMCPPDPLGQRLPQDVEAVQSYRIVNGQLQLELAGNAGSYIWARAQP
jgi:para-nitrobenzyl esterase